MVVSKSIDDSEVKTGVTLALGTIISLTVAGLIIRRMYRCPVCNNVPMRTVPGWKNEFGAEPRDIARNPPELRRALAIDSIEFSEMSRE